MGFRARNSNPRSSSVHSTEACSSQPLEMKSEHVNKQDNGVICMERDSSSILQLVEEFTRHTLTLHEHQVSAFLPPPYDGTQVTTGNPRCVFGVSVELPNLQAEDTRTYKDTLTHAEAGAEQIQVGLVALAHRRDLFLDTFVLLNPYLDDAHSPHSDDTNTVTHMASSPDAADANRGEVSVSVLGEVSGEVPITDTGVRSGKNMISGSYLRFQTKMWSLFKTPKDSNKATKMAQLVPVYANDDEFCFICNCYRATVILWPCRHTMLCDTCLQRLADRKCPTCRENVKSWFLIIC